MKFNSRKASPIPPGVTGTARVGKPTSTLLPRLHPGDIAVIDHVDLDSDTAAALVDAGVVAVVNAARMVSGRYANLGPEVLAEAGVLVVDQVGDAGLDLIRDEQQLRVHDGVVYAVAPDGQTEELTAGRPVTVSRALSEQDQPRAGLAGQLDTMAHAATDLLRREQEPLLDGRALPDLATQLAGRPVVVVAQAEHGDLQAIKQFVREQTPAVIAVGAAADDVLGLSWVPDVVVVTAGDPGSMPSRDALRIASDVVLLAPPGSSLAEQASIEATGATPHLVDSTATAEDVALLLADHHAAALVIGVGLSTRLEDFLGTQPAGRAGSFATRLKVGSRLVDARAVRDLYSAGARPMQVLLVLLAGVVALLAAISVTPVGQDWADSIVNYFQGLT